MTKRLSMILIIMFGILACSNTVAPVTLPVVRNTYTPVKEFTPTLTSSPTLAPTETTTLVASNTPTAQPSATQTPVIIEITPLGPAPTMIYWFKDVDIDADYTVFGSMNVRSCIWMDTCASVRTIAEGSTVHVILKRTVYPSGEIWLMLDENPVAWVALTIPGLGTFGELH